MITPPVSHSSNGLSNSSLYFLFLTLLIVCLFLFALSLIIFILVRKKRKSGFALAICLLSIPCAIACYIAMPKKIQASISDIRALRIDELAPNVWFEIQPKADIENLELNFIFNDSEGRIVDQQWKELGDVRQGEKYVVLITLEEFSFSQFVQIHSWDLEVKSGTIYK